MPSPALQRAEALVDLGRWQDALAALAALPPDDHTRGAALRAQCLLALGRPREALGAARIAQAASPEDEWPHRLVAVCCRALGRSKQAHQAALTAASLEPASPRALGILASCELDLGNLEAAHRAAAAAVQVAPHDPEGYELLARVALRARQLGDAEGLVRHALQLAPEDADLIALLAEIQLAAGRLDEARATQVAAARADPTAARHRDAVATPVVATSIAGVVIGGLFALSGLRRGLAVIDQYPSPVVSATAVFALFIWWGFAVRDRRKDRHRLPDGVYAGLRRHRRRSDLRWLRTAGLCVTAVGIFATFRWLLVGSSGTYAAAQLGVGALIVVLTQRWLRHYDDLSEPTDLRPIDWARLAWGLLRGLLPARRS